MKPKLLDLYCGAGGAAKGYQRAGFYVVGVDSSPQPNYCGDEFILADSLGIDLSGYNAFHASPPCQAHSTIAKQNRSIRPDRYNHPDLIAATRGRLVSTCKPYLIENVPGAPLLDPVLVCGSFFGLDIRRHRLFESNIALFGTPCCHYWQRPRFRSLDRRKSTLSTVIGVHGHTNYTGEAELREVAMGIDWMTSAELVQAIPPAYTEFLGNQLIKFV